MTKSRRLSVGKKPTDLEGQARGLGLRLLICRHCASVWPTERDEAHGGSRSDGDPCAYRWPDGRVCGGTVWPIHAAPPRERVYSKNFVVAGSWHVVLGVEPDATIKEVRLRYRKLALEHHPDVGGDHVRMQEINDAYRQALGDLGQP